MLLREPQKENSDGTEEDRRKICIGCTKEDRPEEAGAKRFDDRHAEAGCQPQRDPTAEVVARGSLKPAMARPQNVGYGGIGVNELRQRAAGHSARGQYREAKGCLRRALRLIAGRDASLTLDDLLLWNELGMACKYSGKFGSAMRCYRLALRYAPRLLAGPECDFFLANLYHNLGGLEHSRRRFPRGERYARKSLELRRKVAGANSLAVAADKAALAAILDGQRKFAESEKLYRQALCTYRREYGTSHPEIAVVLNNLGALYQATAHSRRAESNYRAALEMKRMELGASHPDVAVTLNNLALCYQSRGDAKAVRRCFRRALRILGATLGNSHPNTRTVRSNFLRLKVS
jgi:tetratricopeptide (TPR) repeat protein